MSTGLVKNIVYLQSLASFLIVTTALKLMFPSIQSFCVKSNFLKVTYCVIFVDTDQLAVPKMGPFYRFIQENSKSPVVSRLFDDEGCPHLHHPSLK